MTPAFAFHTKRNILMMAAIYCSLFLHFVFPDVFFNTWTSDPGTCLLQRGQSLKSKHIKSDLFFVCFYAAT